MEDVNDAGSWKEKTMDDKFLDELIEVLKDVRLWPMIRIIGKRITWDIAILSARVCIHETLRDV